jgi:hypothetical protein
MDREMRVVMKIAKHHDRKSIELFRPPAECEITADDSRTIWFKENAVAGGGRNSNYASGCYGAKELASVLERKWQARAE